jgi:hypothetical protein
LLNVAKKVRGVPQEVTLNGQPALVFVEDARVEVALVLDIRERKIVAVRTVSNPDKLARLNRELDQARQRGQGLHDEELGRQGASGRAAPWR